GGPPPSNVSVGEARDGSLLVRWTFLGEIRARKRAELAAGAEGEIRQVLVREGDSVSVGDLLLDVDGSLARARLRAVRAASQESTVEGAQAIREAERFARAGTDAVAGVEIERAGSRADALRSANEQLRAEVAEARAALRRHRVVAPFAGVVARRWVDPGDWVSPGTRAIELVSVDELEVFVNVHREVLEHVETEDPATLRSGARRVDAAVAGIVRALDPESRTGTLRLRPNALESWLLPGATTDVVIEVELSEPGTIVVPRDALVQGAVATRVFKLEGESAVAIDVEVIERNVDEALVRAEGLSAGDPVVVRGNERLRPGQPVTVLAPEPPRP
ncbi:MAG: efflux RND transporter periplasmic adaptor subunit, partial [Myxococcota bacterium]